MEAENRKRFDRKTLIAGAFALVLFAGLVYAAYTVITTMVGVEVQEAFELYYAIPEEGQQCTDPELEYTELAEAVFLGTMYPGESRTVCIKIHNLSSASLMYDVLASVPEGLTIDVITNPPVAGNGDSYPYIVVLANDDAVPGEYYMSVDVTRGE
ncbi:MAG: hypothetical protein ACTSV7_14965 [Candidatus Baldrarchaeia archaeon]